MKSNFKMNVIGKENQACDLESISKRLHRLNGQVGSVERMLREKRDFTHILQQIIAARQALDKVAVLVLESEARGCLKDTAHVTAGKDLQKIAAALFKAI